MEIPPLSSLPEIRKRELAVFNKTQDLFRQNNPGLNWLGAPEKLRTLARRQAETELNTRAKQLAFFEKVREAIERELAALAAKRGQG